MSRPLTNVKTIIAALGGRRIVSSKADVTYEAVCNWEREGKFPSRTYVAFQTELRSKGHTAPARLWGMIRADRTLAVT